MVKDWKVNKPLSELSTTKRKEAVDMLTELHLFYLQTPMYANVWQRYNMKLPVLVVHMHSAPQCLPTCTINCGASSKEKRLASFAFLITQLINVCISISRGECQSR